MWLQRFTDYILRHRWQAIALTFLSTLVSTYLGKLMPNAPVLLGLLGVLVAVFLGIFGILIATLVTLVKGVVEGAIFALAATLPYLISVYVPVNNAVVTPSVMLWIGVGVAVLSNVLTWVFAVMLRRHTGFSLIIQIAALLGVLAISVIHLVYPGIADWWGSQLQFLQAFYAQASTAMKTTAAPGHEVGMEAINVAKQFATGVIVAAILCNALLQLIVARWWQAILFKPGSLRRELHGIRLSQLAGVLFFISLVLSYLGNSVILDIMPVLYMLFGAAGLSLIHYLFGLMHSPTVWFWLSVFYLTLIFSWPFSVVLVAMLGWLDIWLDVRKRFRKV